jgi:hypothetical protein
VAAALEQLRASVAQVQASVDSGLTTLTAKLAKLSGRVDDGFQDVAMALATMNDSAKDNVVELKESLARTTTNVAAQLEKATLQGADIRKLLKSEFSAVEGKLMCLKDDMEDSEGMAALHKTVEAMRKDLLKSTDAAKADQAALRSVLGEVAGAVGVLAGQVEAMRSEVGNLANRIELATSALAAELRAENKAAAAALGVLKTSVAGLLESGVQASPQALKELLEGQKEAVLAAAGALATAVAGAAAQATAEQLQAALETGFAALGEAQAEASVELLEALREVAGQVEAIEGQARRIEGLARNQVRLLGDLMRGESSCPSLVVLAPKKTSGSAVWRAGKSIAHFGRKEFKLWVVCSTCLRLADSGPKKTGYTVRLPEGWLIRAAPSLQLGLSLVLTVCAVAAKTGGLCLPFGTNVELLSGMEVQAAALLMGDLAQDITEAAALAVSRSEAMGTLDVEHAKAASRRVMAVTGNSFKALEALFKQIDPMGNYYGADLVSGGGGESFARQWVCPCCSPGFKAKGRDFSPGDNP